MKKQAYRALNEAFMEDLLTDPSVGPVGGGVYRRVLAQGNGGVHPTLQSVVTVNYTGRLINGRVFDTSATAPCPPAMRVSDLIDGWRIALPQMCVGDRWEIYVPAERGYGSRPCPGIPAGSTLIFDVELLGVM